MSPGVVFVIRAVLTSAASVFLNWAYVGRLDLIKTALLAGFILGMSYLFEAFRKKRDNGSG